MKEGDEVEEKQPIAVIEAMKMETNILAPQKGVIDKVYINEGQQVKAGELIAKVPGSDDDAWVHNVYIMDIAGFTVVIAT